jgi:hypothetical protein
MEPTLCSLTKVKPDGTTFQIEDLMLNATPDMESSLQSTFIITISIPKPMSNLELPEELKELMQDSSSLKVNSVMRPNGENFLMSEDDSNLFI